MWTAGHSRNHVQSICNSHTNTMSADPSSLGNMLAPAKRPRTTLANESQDYIVQAMTRVYRLICALRQVWEIPSSRQLQKGDTPNLRCSTYPQQNGVEICARRVRSGSCLGALATGFRVLACGGRLSTSREDHHIGGLGLATDMSRGSAAAGCKTSTYR